MSSYQEKRPRATVLSVALLVLASACAAPERAPSLADDAIRELLLERVERGQNAGIVVGLLEPDGSRRVLAAGTPHDGVFEIGSITKVFTSILLSDMVNRGEVALSDPVAKFLPPEARVPSRNGKEITLLDLATHHSGLPRMPDNFAPADTSNPYVDYTVEQLYAFISNHELTRDPGAEGEYSNLAMGLLGHALALRAGMSYEELLEERILEPLGMADTAIALTPEMESRLAIGHTSFGDPTSNWDIPTLAGAGAIRSTVQDMLRFAAANLSTSDDPLHVAIRATHEPRRPFQEEIEIGLNWIIMQPEDIVATWHNGGTGGYRSCLALDLEGRRAVIALSNQSNSVDDLTFHLLDPAVELEAPGAGVAVAQAYRARGIDEALARARSLKEEGVTWDLGEPQLNNLAYTLMGKGALDDAIALLQLNVEWFPDHFNPYDTMGEAYMMKGDKLKAIELYRKSLELNPDNRNAVAKLEELGEAPKAE